MRRNNIVMVIGLGLTFGACGDEGTGAPIKIGLSASLSGFDAEWGMTARDVAVASVAHVNERGGVNGRMLELVIADDGSEADPAAIAVQTLIDADVVGIIGGFWSNQLETVTPLVRDAQIPLLSPSSTAPELVKAPPDDGFVFRVVPNDNFQSLAMARYLADIASPAVASTAIVHQDDSYGSGLSTTLTAEWTRRGRTVTGAPIKFATDMDQAAADALWATIMNANPTNVVLIGGGADSNILLRTWKASGQLPSLRWFLSDAAKQSALFGAAATELPATIAGVRGSAPTYPRTGLAFRTYGDEMLARLGMDITKESYFPNVWDSVHLLAGGLTLQDRKGEELGGPGLRDAIQAVSKGGQVFHAGQWRDFVASIQGGGDVDYDGASGPVDFDADGETVSPYEVWEARRDTAGWGFVQVEYLNAADLTR